MEPFEAVGLYKIVSENRPRRSIGLTSPAERTGRRESPDYQVIEKFGTQTNLGREFW